MARKIGNKKHWLFTAAVALVPAAFLLTLEVFLRLFGLYRQPPLLIEMQQGGKAYYQLNQWVARRYFDPNQVTVPGLQPDKFLKEKADQTFRIFCLGESTTAGFPFDCQVPFPVQLRYLLSQAYPEYHFEVLNTGISAVSSFTVIDFLPEILAQRPDLIIIYLGHNEFYGAYGSASTVFLGQSDRFIRFYLQLQKLHVVQMLKRFIAWIAPGQPLRPDNKSLMANVVRDQAIPYQSEKYRHTLQNFSNNLDIILQECAEQKVPVIISNLVANILDLPPFASAAPALPKGPVLESYRADLVRGDSLFGQQLFGESVSAYARAFALDSSTAELWYKLGRACTARGQQVPALRWLNGAKDRDLIRFRASEETNQIISQLAAKHGAHFVDMQTEFARQSPLGLLGKNLMVDHLHPDPNGYFIMARAVYQTMREASIIPPPGQAFELPQQPYYVTALDWDIGLIKIFEMTHRWPFPEHSVTLADYQPYGDSLTAAIARQYLFVDNVWSRAHYKLAEAYLQRQDYEAARREYLAVSVFAPEDPYPLQQVAKTFESEKAWDKRLDFLQKVLPLSSQKGMMLYQIAMAQWQLKNYADACQAMLQALDYPDLNRAEKQNARYYLAGFYADAQDFAMSKKVLVGLLEENPNFQAARVFLQQLETGKH